MTDTTKIVVDEKKFKNGRTYTLSIDKSDDEYFLNIVSSDLEVIECVFLVDQFNSFRHDIKIRPILKFSILNYDFNNEDKYRYDFNSMGVFGSNNDGSVEVSNECFCEDLFMFLYENDFIHQNEIYKMWNKFKTNSKMKKYINDKSYSL